MAKKNDGKKQTSRDQKFFNKWRRIFQYIVTHWGYQLYLKLIYRLEVYGKENIPKDLVNSVFCAPWTKCVKRELFVPFPENTLLEDVVQHIAQVDVINSIGLVDVPVVVWNRTNENAISSEVKTYTRDDKRYSSVYRNVADLLDLRCTHDYCEEHRQWRLNNYIDIVQRGDILGLINGVKTR